MSNPNVLVGASTRAEDQNYKINIVDNVDYTILNNDYYDEIWDDPSSAHREVTFPDPTIAINLHRKIKIKNDGNGSYKITLLPDDTEKFIVYSGNEKWELTSFELLQAGDWCEFIGDGTNWIKCNEPYWHKFDNPGVGSFDSKVDVWNVDNFTTGLTVTYTMMPIGSVALKEVCQQSSGVVGNIYYRKNGDTNISNTPVATGEASHLISNINGALQTVMYFSYDFKVQFAVSSNAVDLYLFHPIEYLQ